MKKAFQTIAIFLLAVVLLRGCAVTSCVIPFSGMENTLYRGDRVLVNRWSYGYRMPFMNLLGYHRVGGGEVQLNDIVLFNSPASDLQEPIDGRALYISRCVGLPGDTLMLNAELQLTNEKVISPDRKLLYSYPGEQEGYVQQILQKLQMGDNELVGYDGERYIRSFSHYEFYMIGQQGGNKVQFTCLRTDTGAGIHPFVVPVRGKAVRVYPWNAKLLCNTLLLHEGRQATVKNDTLYLDGKPVKWCTFNQNYYWMSSSNSINLCDSRLFGFVPESHLLGRAFWVWFSKDPEKPFYQGYRWDRLFQSVR